MPHIDRILASIRGHYSSRRAWEEEKDEVRNIVSAVSSEFGRQYELDECLGVGGSGVVLRVHDLMLNVDRALKFPRPSPGKETILSEVLASETDRLIELSHPYLMRIHTKGEVSIGSASRPYYVMDVYESIADSDAYVRDPEITEGDLIQLLERVLDAVNYMHEQGRIHLDLKPGNILVRPGNRPVISDLGFAKVLQDDSGLTFVGGTQGYIHPDAQAFIAEASSDQNRHRGEAPRFALSPTWDLYSLGRTILRLLRVLEERGQNPEEQDQNPLSLYTHRYVKLLAYRLLDGRTEMEGTLLGLSRSAFSEIRYVNALEALQDIRKLTGGFNLETRIPELNQYGSATVQVSTFSTTPFTPRVKALIGHPEVARLAGFTQLSLLNLVYPTATHTRLEHTMGVFSAMCRYLRALIRDPINPLFRQIMTERDIAASLAVALIHDIGHYALAHDLEEAESDIFSHENRGRALLKDKDTGLQTMLECRVVLGKDEECGKLLGKEECGRRLGKEGCSKLSTNEPGWDVRTKRILAILEADVKKRRGTVKDRIIHALIDGPIDADKLDYIIRDSTNLGLTYGSVIDVERLLRVLTIVTRQDGDDTYVNVGIHEKGRVTAEAVAFARYALYGSVYWHHAYRSIKSMLQRMAWQYLEKVAEGDKKKRAGVAKTAKETLYGVLSVKGGGALQSLPLTASTGSTQLHPGDRAVLEWLAEGSGDRGRELAELIQERKLFKRVLVISSWGNNELWESVMNIFSDHRWRRKLRFQRIFQDELVAEVQVIKEKDMKAQTMFVFANEKGKFLAAARRQEVVVLVDAIRSKPGATSGLEVVQEEDRRRARIDEAPMSQSAQSILWRELQDALRVSLGKVRVFCHPDHARFVSAFDRELVERVLDRAIRAL